MNKHALYLYDIDAIMKEFETNLMPANQDDIVVTMAELMYNYTNEVVIGGKPITTFVLEICNTYVTTVRSSEIAMPAFLALLKKIDTIVQVHARRYNSRVNRVEIVDDDGRAVFYHPYLAIGHIS